MLFGVRVFLTVLDGVCLAVSVSVSEIGTPGVFAKQRLSPQHCLRDYSQKMESRLLLEAQSNLQMVVVLAIFSFYSGAGDGFAIELPSQNGDVEEYDMETTGVGNLR